MAINELLLQEFDDELKNTRRVLERVPAEKWNWKPDEKSGSLGWMASHIATLPNFATGIIGAKTYEIAGASGKNVDAPANLIKVFEEVGKEARTALSGVTDEQMKETWTLTWNGKVVLEMPRYRALRGVFFNHLIHHRGQLTMYLRAVGAPVPGLYGPSADEKM